MDTTLRVAILENTPELIESLFLGTVEEDWTVVNFELPYCTNQFSADNRSGSGDRLTDFLRHPGNLNKIRTRCLQQYGTGGMFSITEDIVKLLLGLRNVIYARMTGDIATILISKRTDDDVVDHTKRVAYHVLSGLEGSPADNTEQPQPAEHSVPNDTTANGQGRRNENGSKRRPQRRGQERNNGHNTSSSSATAATSPAPKPESNGERTIKLRRGTRRDEFTAYPMDSEFAKSVEFRQLVADMELARQVAVSAGLELQPVTDPTLGLRLTAGLKSFADHIRGHVMITGELICIPLKRGTSKEIADRIREEATRLIKTLKPQ